MIDRIVLKMGGREGQPTAHTNSNVHVQHICYSYCEPLRKGDNFVTVRGRTRAQMASRWRNRRRKKTNRTTNGTGREERNRNGTMSICRRRNIFRCFPRFLPLYATRNKSNDERSGTAFDSSRTFLPHSRIVSHTHTHTREKGKMERNATKGSMINDTYRKALGSVLSSATSRVQARGWLLFTHFIINYQGPELSDESIIHRTRFHFTVSGAVFFI